MPTEKRIIELYSGEVKIEFLPNSHSYRLDGKPLISVSSALSVLDKPALKQWAVNRACDLLLAKVQACEQITPDLIEAARYEHRRFAKQEADLGSLVHLWAENFIRSEIEGQPQPELPEDERYLNGVLAFLRWKKEYKIKFVSTERVVYSKKYNFVGMLDCEARVAGKLCVIDFKTSSGFWDEYRFQTAAYQCAAEEEGSKYDADRIIARFDKNTGEFETREFGDLKKDFSVFTFALGIKERQKELEKLNKELCKV